MSRLKLYEEFDENPKSKEATASKETPFLDKLGKDLTKMAEDGKVEPVVGREKEMDQVIWILSRKTKNNPILLGEAGVGKTAIAEGIASMILSEDCPESLVGKRVISIDMASIMAGASKQGDLEKRITMMLEELEANDDIILFMDEIHLIVNTTLSIDVANMLKPALARGTMRCIGATTNDEYMKTIERDKALSRRFQKVVVEEPNIEDTIKILNGIKSKYEDFHKVKYTDEAIVACVKLSGKYVSDRFFPDKAIDLLDEVGARLRISKKSTPPEVVELEKELLAIKARKNDLIKAQKYEESAAEYTKEKAIIAKLLSVKGKYSDENRIVVTAEDVEKILALKTGIPLNRISGDESSKVLDLEKELKMQIIGQDEAVTKISKAIRRNRAGLKDPKRPGGVFMFLGSTGVGKTHLVKTLAKNLFGSENDMIRIDMSEYAEKHNVARLIGSPPGYVGHNDGGQLTEKVRRKPYSIILFDELEKAHPDVLNIMLQIFDDGHLTDGQGRKVDFRNTIIIMTSNIGSNLVKDIRVPVGYTVTTATQEESKKDAIKGELSKRLSPEFLNRIDDIIIFASLNKDSIYKIIDLEVKKVSDKLNDMNLSLEITDNFKDLLIEKGYDEKMGARPLKRAIQNYLEDPISDEILKKTLKDVVKVDYDKDLKKITINGAPVNESKVIKNWIKFNESKRRK